MVSLLPVISDGIVGCFFKISVRGPGQNSDINGSAANGMVDASLLNKIDLELI